MIEQLFLTDLESGRGTSSRFDVLHVATPGAVIDGTTRVATCRAVTLLRRRNDERLIVYETDVAAALRNPDAKTIAAHAQLCAVEDAPVVLSDADFELLLRLTLRQRWNRLVRWQKASGHNRPESPCPV